MIKLPKLGILSAFRTQLWWNHLIAPISAVFYFVLLKYEIEINDLYFALPAFLISIFGTASFGYLLNDWTDVEADLAVGKPNMTAKFSTIQFLFSAILLLSLSILPWYFLPANLATLGLLFLLLICFYLYSVKPFRFKERSWLGLLCDTLYGHILPILISLGTFIFLSGEISARISFLLVSLILFLFLKGFRNILTHQIEDRKNDKRAGIKTFVLEIGPVPSMKLLNYILIPLELFLLLIFLIFLSFEVSYIVVLLPVFLIYTWINFCGWKLLHDLPWRERLFKFWYFLNDFYEFWLPLTFLIILMCNKFYYWPIIPIHFILFFPAFKKFLKELDHVNHNFFHE